jgi:murein DD-endopeptidase MepM/ murein hydrolase activator NlpD
MKQLAWVMVGILVITACAAPATALHPSPSPSLAPATSEVTATSLPSNTPTLTPLVAPTVTATLSPTITSTSNATPVPFQVCSPLQDISLADLPSIVSNPFQAPSPGQDDGHHGVDFSYYHRGSHTQMLGLLMYSVLSGKVAAVVNDRPPYGNAIIIETPLADLPADFLQGLGLKFQPTPAPNTIRLTCPTPAATPDWMPGSNRSTQAAGPTPSNGSNSSNGSTPSTGSMPSTPTLPDHYSLYILYAHLENPPSLAVGDAVTCGQTIGAVGNTGNSGNPHLHLETRFGPSGATFTSLSHYNNLATAEEMSNYCTWRVSGVFQLFDPMIFFNLAKTYP